MDLNKSMGIGRLTRDPEVRSIPSGQQVANFSVATNFRWKDSSGQFQDRPEYHDIVAWGKLAEICGQYLTKGKRVYVEGRLQTRDWAGNDGVRRYKTEVIATDMIMLDGPRSAGGGAAPSTPSAGGFSGGASSNQPSYEPVNDIVAPTGPSVPQVDEDEIKVEDIPF